MAFLTKKKKSKAPKQPSLFRQLVFIYMEQAKRRKALRILEKQRWSLDFLSLVLEKAFKMQEKVSLVIKDSDGRTIELTTKDAHTKASEFDDNIFNHLDDEMAVWKFVKEHSSRGSL